MGVLVLVVLGAAGFFYLWRNPIDSPARLLGAPLYLAGEGGGDRVLLLTEQRQVFGIEGTLQLPTSFVRVDMWAFDPATAVPLWRQRLISYSDHPRGNRPAVGSYQPTMLGADRGVVWAFMRDGLRGLSVADGMPVADAAAIAQLNPELSGGLPLDPSFYAFDERGLLVMTADAREWRIDSETLIVRPETARPASESAASPAATGSHVAIAPPRLPGERVHGLQESDLDDGWIGLLSEEEAGTTMLGHVTRQEDIHRRRLWARQGPPMELALATPFPQTAAESAAYAEKLIAEIDASLTPGASLGGRAPMPASPEFLDAALLSERVPEEEDSLAADLLAGLSDVVDVRPQEAIRLGDPDSVLVLHKDRIDSEGRLRLARVALWDGRVLWDSALPLSEIYALMRGETMLVLYGTLFTPAFDRRSRGAEQFVSLDLRTGAARTFEMLGRPAGLAAPESAPAPGK
ncbi:PA2928 family protein [Inquilinus sp. CAU 1745]|uniref:PA2928 family protein n=1 Tax=Inquilinus sp. CAU 1745 TaxID=3140369 RepID=UPI00325B6877